MKNIKDMNDKELREYMSDLLDTISNTRNKPRKVYADACLSACERFNEAKAEWNARKAA